MYCKHNNTAEEFYQEAIYHKIEIKYLPPDAIIIYHASKHHIPEEQFSVYFPQNINAPAVTTKYIFTLLKKCIFQIQKISLRAAHLHFKRSRKLETF